MVKHRDLKIINNYAKRVIKRDTKKLNKDDWNEIGKDIIPNERIRAYYTKKIVMSNLELANSKILDLLNKAGISASKPLEIYKEAYKIAKEDKDVKELIKIADRYIELHDLKPQKVNITETRKTVDYDKLLPETKTQTISTTVNSENKQKEES